jgi:hypothetical protein
MYRKWNKIKRLFLDEKDVKTWPLTCVKTTKPQGADPHPPFLNAREAGRNHLNEEITPLLPTGMVERDSQTFRTCSALAPI